LIWSGLRKGPRPETISKITVLGVKQSWKTNITATLDYNMYRASNTPAEIKQGNKTVIVGLEKLSDISDVLEGCAHVHGFLHS
jgi:hypothetical protein